MFDYFINLSFLTLLYLIFYIDEKSDLKVSLLDSYFLGVSFKEDLIETEFISSLKPIFSS